MLTARMPASVLAALTSIVSRTRSTSRHRKARASPTLNPPKTSVASMARRWPRAARAFWSRCRAPSSSAIIAETARCTRTRMCIPTTWRAASRPCPWERTRTAAQPSPGSQTSAVPARRPRRSIYARCSRKTIRRRCSTHLRSTRPRIRRPWAAPRRTAWSGRCRGARSVRALPNRCRARSASPSSRDAGAPPTALRGGGLVFARARVDLPEQSLRGGVALEAGVRDRVQHAPQDGHERPAPRPDDARPPVLDPAHDRRAGNVGGEALAQRAGEALEHPRRERVLVDRPVDHLGVDEAEVGHARARAVLDELHAQRPAELLDGGLAHRVGERADAVGEGVD